jgi:hypothetical protein
MILVLLGMLGYTSEQSKLVVERDVLQAGSHIYVRLEQEEKASSSQWQDTRNCLNVRVHTSFAIMPRRGHRLWILP